MKRKLLILIMLLPGITAGLFAQDPPMATMRVPYRQVIISEYAPAGQQSYTQLTNVGDSTVNLKDFYYISSSEQSHTFTTIRDTEGNLLNAYSLNQKYLPKGSQRSVEKLPDFLLKPGESFILSRVFDRTLIDGSVIQREQMVEKSNFFVHAVEAPSDSTIYKSYYPELQNYNFDSTSISTMPTTYNRDALDNHDNWARTLLVHRVYNAEGAVIDSVLIDGIKLVFFGATGTGDLTKPNIAGVSEAFIYHMIVRKSNITHGNINWALSAGISAEDSEWLVIPKQPTRSLWTTVGVHGNFTPSATSEILGIDLNNQTLTVPWGIYNLNNGDSLIQKITLGPGMAWRYIQNSQDFASKAHTICQEGDTLILFTTGITLDRKNLRIIREAPEANETRVFPMRTLDYPDPANPLDSLVWGDMPYYVTHYGTIMDTVGNISFATRVDSVFKYLEKPALASWEILWVDGRPRVDLMNGDILKVTAENGVDTKEYYLDVLPFEPAHNAFLASINWPDKPGFLMGWAQDTIPRFDPRITNYNIRLPYQQESVPVLQAIAQDPDAQIDIIPATSVEGLNAERTTHIKVTAEDDSVVLDYYVTFSREKLVEQSWNAEPMFSEMSIRSVTAGAGCIELYNPGTEPIDLSNYLILPGSTATLAGALATAPAMTTDAHWQTRYSRAYIPGFKWPTTLQDYLLQPGYMIFDPVIDPILEPGETFTIYSAGNEGPFHWVNKRADVIFFTAQAMTFTTSNAGQEWQEIGGNQWGEYGKNSNNFAAYSTNNSIWLLKIVNDSIQRGLKPIRDAVDFEIIDLWGKIPSNPFNIAGEALTSSGTTTAIRKPHVYLPNTINQGGWGTTAEDSDWKIYRSGFTYNSLIYTGEMLALDFGYHTAEEVTFFRSNVYSNIYKVDEGFEGDLSIRGVSGGENVQTFYSNLIKADTGQVLVLSATPGGPAKELTETVAENDILTVTSTDAKSQTAYKVSLAPLDGNNSLSLAGGSDLVITREGDAGTISGFPFGSTIIEAFEQVVKPPLSTLLITNVEGELLPLTVINNDTVKVPVVVDNQVYFKVIAENGNAALYHLQPSSLLSDAYVLSEKYVVDQEASTISVVLEGTSVSTFLAELKPVAGATMIIRTKIGGERNLGPLTFDDFLYVTSGDQSVVKIYYIQFIGEAEGLQTEFRTLAPDPSNLTLDNVSEEGTQATIFWSHDSGLEFGFVIVRDGAPVDTVITYTFTDQGLVKGLTYQYSVYAFNEFGNSGLVNLSVNTTQVAVDQTKTTGISIFPNVTNDMVYFRNIPEGSCIMLTDLAGRSILVKNASDIRGGLSLQPYANGYYMVRILQGREYLKSVKVLKK